MNELKQVISSLTEGFKNKEVELFQKITEELNIDFSRIEDGQTFDLLLRFQFEKFLNGFITQKFGDSDKINFLLLNYRFIERHYLKWIVDIEGSDCSADKSRTIMKALLRFYQTGKKWLSTSKGIIN